MDAVDSSPIVGRANTEKHQKNMLPKQNQLWTIQWNTKNSAWGEFKITTSPK